MQGQFQFLPQTRRYGLCKEEKREWVIIQRER